jgi:hypothetical protein
MGRFSAVLMFVSERGLFLRCLPVAVLAAVALLGMAHRLGDVPARSEWRAVTVQAGDSLWGIAKQLAPPEADVRCVVADIRDRNSLDTATVFPGQVLVVPAWTGAGGRRG